MKGWKQLENEERKKKNKVKNHGAEFAAILTAAALSPCVFWFNIYNNNMASMDIKSVIVLTMVLSCVSIMLYFAFTIFMSKESALLPVVSVWIVFWLFPTVHNYINKYYAQSALNLLFIFACLIIILCCVLHKKGVSSLVSLTLSCVVFGLFFYNSIGPIYGAIKNSISPEPYSVKTSFHTNDDLERPNIYWLHMDGMMGFNAVKNVLGDDQNELKQALGDRGFIVNEDAELDIGWTRYAFPALTSPTIYDSYLHDLFSKMDSLTSLERRSKLFREYAYDIYLAYPKLELFKAFQEAGYETYEFLTNVGRLEDIVPAGYFYDEAFTVERTDRINRHNIIRAFLKSSILGEFIPDDYVDFPLQDIKDYVPEYGEEIIELIGPDTNFSFDSISRYDQWLLRMTLDGLSLPSPKLLYIQNLIPHNYYNHDENGMYQYTESAFDMSLYLPQAKYAEKIMLYTIDMILESDPNAVIVIQADHGVHLFERKVMSAQGYTDDQMLEMNYSTISAVRIPEKYGTLSEPLDPLDITRYLVNHFVGDGNYDYLYYHEEE